MLHTNTGTQQQYVLLVNQSKVLDRVIDVYHWVNHDLNTAEVIQLGNHLINLARRRATDVELFYQENRIDPTTPLTDEEWELMP